MSKFWVNNIPTTRSDDWKQALQEPDKQWKPAYSAWALAHSWEAAQGFPPEVKQILKPHFTDIAFLKGFVEYKVPMPAKGKPSHNDLFVQATSTEGDLCIAVEGKVSETLGQTLAQWHDGSPNRENRLAALLNLIGLPRTIPETIRYQLLHRMASPVIAAKQTFHASYAVMLIHSFSDLDASFTDFTAFLALYGVNQGQVGTLYPLKTVNDVTLYAGWVRGDSRFLLGK